ncbi:MAG: SDR family NAD(P)-dependent oxidoreductase [Gammaproteobacteria bacterium]|jgi:NAD(P)-dependent dehydrogenase (short-subunit alcohol dehydrogenase family)|nr:SDR family NAD(P)-dependent oxidoreductase [Gammaproteobacteria bacterium]
MTLLKKNILITGSSDGIGKMLAIEFSKLGSNIILLGRNEERLDQVYDQLDSSHTSQKHLILQADLNLLNTESAHEILEAINQEFNSLDGIIHNAAILGNITPLEDYDLSTWDQVINVNLRAPFLLTKTLKTMLMDSAMPRLVFTSSGVANEGRAFWGAYSVSKFGIKGLAEIFAEELETTSSIKVFNFDPGATQTKMRASARPAEDPMTVKSANELLNCYLWFFSEESKLAKKNYFEYAELSKLLT